MSFNQALADRILEFAALEPTIPVGTGHDFYDPEFDEDDFYDGIKKFLEFRENLGHTFDGDDPLEAVLLVDVTLVTSPNQKITMPFVYLFIDQIIGVSCGKI